MAIINPNGSLPVDILSGAGSIDIDAWIREVTGDLGQFIRNLFSNSEQGFAYDINDLSTLFQDAAGTIPVTGAGQPVGLVLDKSGRGNRAYQTNAASRPLLQRNATTGAYYLAFDGVDDFLVTNSIDFTSTDKVSLFAGVRKLSDATTGLVCELGVSLEWSFMLFAPAANGGFKYNIRNRSAGLGAATSDIKYGAPHSAVFGGVIDSKKDITLRVNGSSISTSTEVSGVNFVNAPLYIGRRGGTSLPFNGHLYGLIGVARLSTDAETTALEKAIAKNVGVTL